MRQSMPSAAFADPGLKAILEKFLDDSQRQQRPLIQKHVPALLEAMAGAYTRAFSLTELRDVRAFSQFPSGRSYLSKSTAIIGDPAVTRVNAALMKESQALTQQTLPAFTAEIVEYVKSHPEVAKAIAAEGK